MNQFVADSAVGVQTHVSRAKISRQIAPLVPVFSSDAAGEGRVIPEATP